MQCSNFQSFSPLKKKPIILIMFSLKNFSFSAMTERFGQSFKRFPVAMLLSLFLGCYLIYLNHGGTQGFIKDFLFVFYPATGAVLAVALTLITEEFKNWKVAALVQAIVHVAWLAVSVYLAGFDRFSTPQIIAVSATIAAMSLSVFVACFYRKHQDVQFWNFSIRTVMALGLSVAICALLTLGLILFLESLKMLFGIEVDDGPFGDLTAVCMTMLAPALFMNLIPKGENKHLDTVVEFSRFSKGVVQYLFVPLLALYMITLYIYAAQILFEWKLPVGGVSYLVSGSMVLMVLLIYITYPIQHQEGNRFFKRLTRWLPVVMLPLLALMTVAIWRRLSDYGITVSRLYLLVFNLWCYAVCLWLIITRNKRIWLIPASFAVILLLISVGPQSITNVTLSQLKKEVRTAFTASGLTRFPLSGAQYANWLETVDHKTAASIDGKLDYIQDFYRFNDITDLVAKDVVLGRIAKMDETKSESNGYEYYSNWRMIQQMDIPSQYRKMEWVEMGADCLVDVKDDLMTIDIKPKNGKEQMFELSVRALIALDEKKWEKEIPGPLVMQNDKALFVVNHFTLSINEKKTVDFVNLDGMLFTK